MDETQFAQFLLELKSNPDLGSYLDEISVAAPEELISALLDQSIHPSAAGLAPFPVILLGRYASVLGPVLRDFDEAFQSALRDAIFQLFIASTDADALPHVSVAAARLSSLYFESSPPWFEFLFGDSDRCLGQLLASGRPELVAAVFDCWCAILEKSEVAQAYEAATDRLAQLQVEPMPGEMTHVISLAAFRLGYGLLGRRGDTDWGREFANGVCQCVSSLGTAPESFARRILQDLLAYTSQNRNFLHPALPEFEEMILDLIPSLDQVSQRYALQIAVNELIEHFNEFLLDRASVETTNPFLKKVLEICVGMIAEAPTDPGDQSRSIAEDLVEELASEAANADDYHILLWELMEEVLPTVEAPHQLGILVCFKKSVPHVAVHYCSHEDYDSVLVQAFRLAAQDAAPELRCQGLAAWEAYIRHSWSETASFAEEALPFAFELLKQETVDDNLAMVCKLIAAYCRNTHKPFLRARDAFLEPILREMIPYCQLAKTTEAQCAVVEILASCATSSSPVVEQFAEPIVGVFEAIFADGARTLPAEIFFTSLRFFPKLTRLISAENFNQIVTTMIDDVILGRPFENFAGGQRKAISKFLRTLVRRRCPAALEKLALIVQSLGGIIGQQLEKQEVPLDTASCGAYEVIFSSVQTGECVCYLRSQIDDVCEAFALLRDIFKTGLHELGSLAGDLVANYDQWLSTPMPVDRLFCSLFVASEALFPFLDFENAAVQDFAVRLYKRIALSVAIFCWDLEKLSNTILPVLNRLLSYVTRFMEGAVELAELTLQTIPDALAQIYRRRQEFDNSHRVDEDEFSSNCPTIELQFGRLFMGVAKHWPDVAATFPITEVSLDPNSSFPYAVACGVTAFLPQMMTAPLADHADKMHAKVFEVRDEADVNALGMSCHLFETLVREKVVSVEQVAQMVQGCDAWTRAAKTKALKWDGGVISCLLLAIMAHYHTEMPIGVAFTLFGQFMSVKPERLDEFSISETVEDLAAVVRVLKPAEPQAKWFRRFVQLLEKQDLFPWDADVVAEVKEALQEQ